MPDKKMIILRLKFFKIKNLSALVVITPLQVK